MSPSNIAALAAAAVLLVHAVFALRWATLTRQLTRARARWYRATVSAAQYGLPTPGPIEGWPGVADLEHRLQRLRPERWIVSLVALTGFGIWLVAL